MRGCNINHCSKITGFTPLRWAIQNKLPSKFIKFLLKNGANPHIEAADGYDACDVAKTVERYRDIKVLTDKNGGCSINPRLRIKSSNLKLLTIVNEGLGIQYKKELKDQKLSP